MGVGVVSDEVGEVLDEEGGEVACPVLGAGGAESPFEVAELVEAGTFGQQAAVGDAGRQGAFFPAEEA